MTIRNANLSFSKPEITLIPAIKLNDSVTTSLKGTLETFVFLHTPKTAGTNISFLMTALFKLGITNGVFRFGSPRVNGQSPNLISDGWQGGLESARDPLYSRPPNLEDYDFISGHMPLGLDRVININPRYFSIIRHPVDREISSVNFDYQRGFIEAEVAKEYMLDTMIDNPQTRILAGDSCFTDKCNEEMFNKAIQNIANCFSFIAPQEAINLVLGLLLNHYGIDAIGIARPQVTGIKVFNETDQEMQNQLSQKHSFDVSLFKYAQQYWDQNFASKGFQKAALAPSEKIIVLDSSFAQTKIPKMMSLEQIQHHNSIIDSSELVMAQQKHSEAPKKRP